MLFFQNPNKGKKFHEKKDKVGSKCYDTWVNYISGQPKTDYPPSRAKGICIIGGVIKFGAFVKGKFAIRSNNKYMPKTRREDNRAHLRRAEKGLVA